jgi:hypothetical protein
MLIQLPPPDPPVALITPPSCRSSRSCADPPPPEPQSISSTTATSLLFERMRDQQLWACAWLSTCSFQSAVVFLFYLIIGRDCVALPSIDVETSTPPKDEVAVVCPPDRNSDARGQVLFDATAVPIRPPLPLPGRHPTQVAAPLHDFDNHDHLDLGYLGIKGLSSACGTRRFLLQS